ncbi:MAG: 16S rRNA (uracil(1498)-N(3))-methyltransferase [Clostridia bacterium]|nr:16S rRNA (uracil(1498)-N(3))-methyltransferase [Clostridia bacterium]
MPRFFVDKSDILADKIVMGGEDAKHISLSLRARVGERLTVCDGQGTDYDCEISEITKNEVVLSVLEQKKSGSEPDIEVTLYQALVKSDKFDFIVQKCTELGVSKIVPVVTDRCISKPDDASLSKKLVRWNKIAKEAAMQSGRGIIPAVEEAVLFDDALDALKSADCGFLCYEANPHIPINEIYEKCGGKSSVKTVAFLIGPEGGISDKEADEALAAEVFLASLGPRILRTETAPLCVMSSLMLMSDNMI